MDTLLNDVRHAIRGLAKSKLFTAVALLSLALGIGANVTVFSIVDALAFKALPYVDADRLVDLHEWSATKLCGDCAVGTSYAEYEDWRAAARSFSGMGAYLERPFVVSGTETAERIGGALVSATTFDVLGIRPALGRGFAADDDRVGAAPVVLLGDAIWNSRYGADRRIVGRTIKINGVAHTVIGVMPPKFEFPEFAKLWVPAAPNVAGMTRADRDFGVVARLAPRATLANGDAEIATLAKAIAARYPETQDGWTARATPLRSNFSEVPPAMYLVLLGAVGFVLLIVCANLAGLLLARGAGRQREIAIRLALGATRGRIVRHLLTEAVLLSVVGGGLGVLVSLWGVDLGVHAIGTTPPFYIDFSPDGTMLGYAIVVSIVTGLLFGLLPALRSSTPDVHTALKETGTLARRSRTRGLLVVGELALAMVLLAGTGVLGRSVLRLAAPERGTDGLDLLRGDLELLDTRYRNPAAIRSTVEASLARLTQAPAVASASIHASQFIAGFGVDTQFIQAVDATAGAVRLVSPRFAYAVTPGYFSTVKLPIVAGRAFDDADRAGSTRVAMINKHMADVLWPGRSPLGRTIKLGSADSLPALTVVGVTGDISARGAVANYAYVPFAQATTNRVTLLVRSNGDPLGLAATARAAVRAVDPDLPLTGVQTVRQARAESYHPYQMYALTIGIFAAFAVLLAAVGLYGVIAYSASQRTREIGVRIALGAEQRHVMAMIATQGGRLVALGIVAGTAGSALLLRLLRGLLFGASPIDLPVFAAVALVLGLVASVAIWLPARRASRIDPLQALRAE